MRQDIRKRLERLEGPHPDIVDVILEELPDGALRRPGDGRIFTPEEVGDAAKRVIAVLPAIAEEAL